MSRIYDRYGILVAFWDDETRTYFEYDAQGIQTLSRPYTTEENTEADAAATAEAAEAARAAKAAEDAAILAAIAATAKPPADDTAWVQPTGAVNAYPLGAKVSHGGKNWVSLTPYNVWQPGVSSWREEVAQGYPAWVQPTGAQDAYNIGDRVSFEGSNYESVIAANVWSPTVYPAGWVLIP